MLTATLATQATMRSQGGGKPYAGRPRLQGAAFLLSYKIPACHARRMNHERNWRDRALAIEFWLLSALVAGSLVAGLVSAVRYLAG